MGLFILLFAVYVIGGITLFPLLIYAILWISTISSKYSIYLNGLFELKQAKGTNEISEDIQDEIQNRLYKVGWLRVSRNDEQSAPDTTIGDMVVSYISGKKANTTETHDAYAVLKYKTLYLYDSEKQLDCKQVIPLDKYLVTMYPPGLEEFELFTKLPLIKLTHQENELPYYLNCSKCIEKEDWYFALIRATRYQLPHHSAPQHDKTHFDQSGMNHLITTVHSNEHHFQTQWLNALLGRLFFGVYKTDDVKKAMLDKIITKLDKINSKRPPFLGEITVRSVDPGKLAPTLTQPKLISLSPTGEFVGEAFFSYKGGLRVEISTELKWKYSDRLKPLTMDIVLGITVQEISGKAKLIIKEPPTNRFWYGFYELPKMDWKVEPVVWEKTVGYSMVVKAIQQKIEELITETMVIPNYDDITFFPTNGAGGIFEVPPGIALSDKLEKDLSTKSLPDLNTAVQSSFQDKGSPKSAATAPSKLNNEIFSLPNNSSDIDLLSTSPDSLSTASSLTSSLKTLSRKTSNDSNTMVSSSLTTGITNKQMKNIYTSPNTDRDTTILKKSTSRGLIPAKKTALTAVNMSSATAHSVSEKEEVKI
ncbi:hypothetical protein K501DRAFT_289402 [Backusella circina FSU 941]|nr:hypothetical protein K501DRAFT_289402 [Backusella circina FSU 941]